MKDIWIALSSSPSILQLNYINVKSDRDYHYRAFCEKARGEARGYSPELGKHRLFS
jgi:hypothetical protein